MIVMRGPENKELYCEQVEYNYSTGVRICKNVYNVENKTWELNKCILSWYWDIAYETEDPIDGS